MRLAWRAVWRICLNEVVWNYCLREKLSSFFYFLLLFPITKRESSPRRWRAVYISIRKTLNVFYFLRFFDYLSEKEEGVQFRILQLYSHWFGIMLSIIWHKFATVPIKACWILCAFFQFVLRNTGKISCDKVLNAMKLETEYC